MKLLLVVSALLAASACFIYRPVPSGVSEPWKLMLLDACTRFMRTLGTVGHWLGLGSLVNTVSSRMMMADARSDADVTVVDTTLGGLPTRVFVAKSGEKLKRGVLYFHGGGWAYGSGRWKFYDSLLRRAAKDLDAVVMSVDYRLYPEAVFPAQYNDALAAARAFLSPQVLEDYSMDPGRLGVSGDSAGGNLAAAVALETGSDNSLSVKFKVQALIYPVLQALDFNTPSYVQNQNDCILSRPKMVQFWLWYLGGDLSLKPVLIANNHSSVEEPAVTADIRSRVDWTSLLPARVTQNFQLVVKEKGTPGVVDKLPGLMDVRAAPLLAESSVLSRAPKAYVMTCEFDVLRDDGLMYVRRLQDAGVPVTSDYLKDGFHGCISLSSIFNLGQRSEDSYVHWLQQNL
ncbi:neutral cholesterol ester hydrolase 1-like [Cynoglossus semilaevis]|uniref:neutral cholesterol ester hydrolase 1-like n=1 Tax=Cynoglossus semilaevis TaxID=244447 RepID=UPI000494FD8F|nr:neutral cholesterol ester hydrolase 1-like [Cynoglossus semilaevis]